MKVYAIRKVGSKSYLLNGYYPGFSKPASLDTLKKVKGVWVDTAPTVLPKLYLREGNAINGLDRVVRRSRSVELADIEVVPFDLIEVRP